MDLSFCWFHPSRECDCLHSVSWWTCLFAGSTHRENVTVCIVCLADLSSLWWVFCAPFPLRMVILWILISTRLVALSLGPRPLHPVADSPAHVQNIITGVREPSLYNTACLGELCDPICVRHTRDQLLAISPARLTSDLTSRLRKFDIGFCLPRKRSRRGDKNFSRISFTTSFPFDHSSFELARVSLSMTHQQSTSSVFIILRQAARSSRLIPCLLISSTACSNTATLLMAPPSSLAISACIMTTP